MRTLSTNPPRSEKQTLTDYAESTTGGRVPFPPPPPPPATDASHCEKFNFVPGFKMASSHKLLSNIRFQPLGFLRSLWPLGQEDVVVSLPTVL